MWLYGLDNRSILDRLDGLHRLDKTREIISALVFSENIESRVVSTWFVIKEYLNLKNKN